MSGIRIRTSIEIGRDTWLISTINGMTYLSKCPDDSAAGPNSIIFEFGSDNPYKGHATVLRSCEGVIRDRLVERPK